MAKDSPDFIDNEGAVMDFALEANVVNINSLSIDSILDQIETHYIL